MLSHLFRSQHIFYGPPAIIFLSLFCLYLPGCNAPGNNSKNYSVADPQADSLQLGVKLYDITNELGLGEFHYDNGSYGEYFLPEIMAGGIAFIDYNGDHYQDILLVKGGSMKEGEESDIDGLALFKNVDGLRFEDVTDEMGLKDIHTYGFGFTIGDYDSDGDDDFFLASLTNNYLFRNDGVRFTNVSNESGIFAKNVWSACALFVDADRDGWLDIFVGNYAKWSRRKDRSLFCTVNGLTDDYCSPDMYQGEACSFYHNNGDGTFTEIANEIGLHNPFPTKTLGVVELDYNNDGWPDLFMANDAVPDLLFENQGDGTYKETGMALGVYFGVDGSPTAGMGVAVGDTRNDGYHTIFVGNFSKRMMTVLRYTEHGVYINDAEASLIGRKTINSLNFGLSLFDVDLDGDLDMFAANGHVFLAAGEKEKNTSLLQRPHFFINDGTGKFTDVVSESPTFFADSMLARSTAYADIDMDGDMDLVITNNTGPIHIMRNESNKGNLLKILLRGNDGNRNAIGAKVIIHYGDSLRQLRFVKSSDSYLSQSEFPITFGLGQENKVNEIVISWPAGQESVFQNIDANQFIKIKEGKLDFDLIKKFEYSITKLAEAI